MTRSEKLAAEIERMTGQLRAMKMELFTVRREERCVRVCCKCRKAILLNHKWHYVAFEHVTALAHRNCKNMESYK